MHPTAHAWHPSACHKVEAVCQHFFFVASDEKPRQKILVMAIKKNYGHGSEKNKTMPGISFIFSQPLID